MLHFSALRLFVVICVHPVFQLLHALIDTMLCVLRGLKSPSSPTIIAKLEEDISRLFRLMCHASTIAKTSVTKPKWLDLFNYVT